MNYNMSSRIYRRLNTDTLSLFLLLSGAICVIGLRADLVSIYVTIPFLVALFPAALLLHSHPYPSWLLKLSSVPIKATYGAASGLLIIAFVSAVHGLVSLGWLSVIELLQFQGQSVGLLLLLIVAVHGLHVLLYTYHKHVLLDADHRERVTFYLSSFLTIAVLLPGTLRTIGISLISFMIYSLLIDLFIEQKRSNLLWLIVWTIIIGSFLSIALVAAQNQAFMADDLLALPLLNAFTIFSLIFVASGLLFILYGFINKSNKLLPEEWEFNFGHSLHLRNRIQLSILATLVFSFITIGIVSISHYTTMLPDSAYDLTTGFTQALLNAYVFLFLLGFAISISLSQYIRNPLIILGRTLKDVKLNKQNQKIEWSGTDEIGNLISEYNQMIVKLETNAHQLAEVERDTAWREMSKQVAHEIKNPLTPMKLSLQYLQKSLGGDHERVLAMTERMCGTLMHQIDNLQQIADEFANFGGLPKTANKKVLLNDIVETIHDLFRNRQDMDIHLIEPIDDINVYADKNQLLRVLNNLVKNSIQAIPENIKGHIELKLWKENNKAMIYVKDNGIGIPEDQQNEIFKPKFTTKSSGTGLGLAIAANMLETMGGNIYFDSTHNVGTKFYVELPLIRTLDTKETQHVSLDD